MNNNSDEKTESDIANELVYKINKRRNKPDIQDAKIYYDGKQYTIRIPAMIAKRAKIDLKKDVFRFIYIPPEIDIGEEEPSLKGELIRK